MDQPMVTITLDEYNILRDGADMKKILLDRLSFFDHKLIELENKVRQLENTQK